MRGGLVTGWKPIPLGADETLDEFRYGGRLMRGGLVTGWKPIPLGADETLDEFRNGGGLMRGGLTTGWKPILLFCGGGTRLPPRQRTLGG